MSYNLGCENIFSGDEDSAREYYRKAKSAIEKGNYELIIQPSFFH